MTLFIERRNLDVSSFGDVTPCRLVKANDVAQELDTSIFRVYAAQVFLNLSVV